MEVGGWGWGGVGWGGGWLPHGQAAGQWSLEDNWAHFKQTSRGSRKGSDIDHSTKCLYQCFFLSSAPFLCGTHERGVSASAFRELSQYNDTWSVVFFLYLSHTETLFYFILIASVHRQSLFQDIFCFVLFCFVERSEREWVVKLVEGRTEKPIDEESIPWCGKEFSP